VVAEASPTPVVAAVVPTQLGAAIDSTPPAQAPVGEGAQADLTAAPESVAPAADSDGAGSSTAEAAAAGADSAEGAGSGNPVSGGSENSTGAGSDGGGPNAAASPVAAAPPVDAAEGGDPPSPDAANREDPATHPLSVARMRSVAYPGSDLVIEQTLEPGSNYNRFVVSYMSEGNKIYAMLTVPTGERPPSGWPVILFNHGYIPPAQYRTTERYVAYLDAFASNGYIVLKSDYRGHGSSEGVATGGRGTPDYTIDVLNGMASVAKHPDADPGRIGMWGHSMGGGVTLRSMVVNNTIKAGVIWAGVVASYTDMYNSRRGTPSGSTTGGGSSRGWRGDLVTRFGTPEENPAAWDAVSPNAYLAEISGPLQIHHGSADSTVPVAYSQTLQQQMEAVGRPSELLIYDGDDHNISKSLSLALRRSVEFFDRHVKGGG